MPVLKVKKNGVWQEIAGVSGHTHTIDDITNFPSGLPANGGNADTLDGKHASEFATKDDVSSLNNKQDKHQTVQATLLASNWDDSGEAQAVSANGVTSSNVVIVTPDPSNYNEYCESGVRCLGQMKDLLLFLCSETPSIDLKVNILILN